MDKMKKKTVTIVLIIIAGAIGFLLAKTTHFLEYFGSPTVTIINLTGESISDITVSLGGAKSTIQNLENTQAQTITIRGEFSESATNVEWEDAEETHKAIADDYMENYGFYHSTVVITDENKAIAIREINKSNK
jgi:hypothetical protein